MASLWQSVLAYRVSLALTMVIIGVSGFAHARLPDATPTFLIRYVDAIHMPTGCVARLELNHNVLIGALIIDPLCLPHGVKARSIPAFKRDFHIPELKREIVKDR